MYLVLNGRTSGGWHRQLRVYPPIFCLERYAADFKFPPHPPASTCAHPGLPRMTLSLRNSCSQRSSVRRLFDVRRVRGGNRQRRGPRSRPAPVQLQGVHHRPVSYARTSEQTSDTAEHIPCHVGVGSPIRKHRRDSSSHAVCYTTVVCFWLTALATFLDPIKSIWGS